MLLVVHEPDSTSNVNVPQRLFINTFSGSRGNRLCDLILNVISLNHINLRRNGLINSSLIN